MTVTDATFAGHDCPLALAVEPRGKAAVITVSGNFTWHTVTDLHDRLAAIATPASLVIDLTDVTVMDSAATSALITAYLRQSQSHQQMAVVATGFAAAVLDRVGLSRVVPTFQNRERAEEWMAYTDPLES